MSELWMRTFGYDEQKRKLNLRLSYIELLTLNEIEKLCKDESELVRDAVIRRKNKA